MKTIFLLFFISSFIFASNAQNTYVPDDNFEQRLIDLGYDDVLDDYVLTSNISLVTSLDIQYLSISNATGLQDFASLTSFNCDHNDISVLNFHPNANLNFFICQFNPLTQLDLSQHTSLFEFSCTNTNIASLDLNQNSNLRYLYCASTPLTILDVSNNPNLLEISAANSNFEFVDIRNGNNEEIEDINFLNNPNLPYIYVDDCNYSSANWIKIDPSTIFIELEGQTECGPLGVENFLNDLSIRAYPIPSNDFLYIEANEFVNIERIEVIDVFGKRIKTSVSDCNVLDVSNLQKGLYLLKISTEKGVLTEKIIKN